MLFAGLPDKTERAFLSVQRESIITDEGSEGFLLPNHSGDLSRAKVLSTPTSPTDLVNKAYVDSISGGGATTGAGAPVSTPTTVGSFYIDTTNLVLYVAMNTTSSSDWKAIISQ